MTMPSNNIDVDNLRLKAEDILRVSGKPFFVEFSGTPKSGKSTCIDIVSHFFRRTGYRVLSPTEGASRRTPRFLRDDLYAFNTWSASYALTHVLEGLTSPEKYQIAILDRGLFDALAWFELLKEKGDVTEEDCKRVQDFLLIEKWRSVIDCVFLFKADPATSLDRENADKLIDEPGRAMNSDFLNDLNGAYDKVREKYADQFQYFEIIDTSESQSSNPKSTAFHVTQNIIDLISGNAS